MKIFSLVIVLINYTLYSAEVDQFTKKDQVIKDSAEIINQKANEYIQQAIKAVNTKHRCYQSGKNEKKLYKELRKYFANHITGEIMHFIHEDESIDKVDISIKESIYRHWKLFSGSLSYFYSIAKMAKVMSPEISINGIKIGTDKFEHMFGQGFSYFKSHYLKNNSMAKTFKKGMTRERYILGGNIFATGIYSYGDFSANFNGMRFWNHILQLEGREDVLGQNLGPYIVCKDGKYQQNKKIDFSLYIDASMNEAINCSHFASQSGLNAVKNSLQDLNLECPINQDLLNQMKEKYNVLIDRNTSTESPIYQWILNLEGPQTVK
jgi:hypothetical protein